MSYLLCQALALRGTIPFWESNNRHLTQAVQPHKVRKASFVPVERASAGGEWQACPWGKGLQVLGPQTHMCSSAATWIPLCNLAAYDLTKEVTAFQYCAPWQHIVLFPEEFGRYPLVSQKTFWWVHLFTHPKLTDPHHQQVHWWPWYKDKRILLFCPSSLGKGQRQATRSEFI